MASYGKRPLWQWVLIYLVIGAIVYGVIYYFILNNNGNGGSYSNTAPQVPQSGSDNY